MGDPRLKFKLYIDEDAPDLEGSDGDEEVLTPDELEEDPRDKRVKDQERFIGQQGSEIAELRREMEQYRAQMAAQNQYTPPTTDFTDPYEQVNGQFWENPGQTAAQMIQSGIQQALQTTKMAQANVKMAMSGLRSDPMFAKVVDQFEAELAQVDDQYFLNAASANATVEAVYERVVGKMARKLVKEQGAEPSARMSILESLGVAKPGISTDDGGEEIGKAEKDMLREMGISGKRQQAVISRFTNSKEEE